MSVEKLNLYNEKCASCVLVTDVSNASEVRKQVIAGELQCAIIKPSLIVDLFQIGVAANKALLAESLGKLTTRTIYSEILFNLSISKNISQSLLKFGIDDKDSNMIIVSFADEEGVKDVLSKIEGKVVNFEHLNSFTDVSLVRKTYKISDAELGVSSLLNAVVNKIATKDFAGH